MPPLEGAPGNYIYAGLIGNIPLNVVFRDGPTPGAQLAAALEAGLPAGIGVYSYDTSGFHTEPWQRYSGGVLKWLKSVFFRVENFADLKTALLTALRTSARKLLRGKSGRRVQVAPRQEAFDAHRPRKASARWLEISSRHFGS